MSLMTHAQLEQKLSARGIQKSESPFIIEKLGTISTEGLETFTAKSGNTYFKLNGYLLRTKSAETFAKSEVTITLIEATKDYKQMKPGDKFIAAE